MLALCLYLHLCVRVCVLLFFYVPKLVSLICTCMWFYYVLSEALPRCDVVYDPRAAVGHVVQSRVSIVEGRRVVLLLDVVWQRVWQAGRKHTNQSECRNKQTNRAKQRNDVKWKTFREISNVCSHSCSLRTAC